MFWALWVIYPLAWYTGLGMLLIVCFRERTNPNASCGRCRYAIAGESPPSAICSECGSEYATVGIRPALEPRSTVGWGIGRAIVVAGVLGMVVLVPGIPRTYEAVIPLAWLHFWLIPLSSITTGVVLMLAARRLGWREPTCMACGRSFEHALGTRGPCSGCGRNPAQAGVRGRRGPRRSTVLLGIATIVVGMIVAIGWFFLSATLIGSPE